ncbi:hypothetical protein KW795_02470, partial [Candidatus Microgenomates bacterium]|nr:hypothetical protein [Candidatus Microgenomates bacterium]
LISTFKFTSVNSKEDKIENIRSGARFKYRDNLAGFAITYPDSLKVYTYRNEFNIYTQMQEKMLFFCENDIKDKTGDNYFRCPNGGIMIWVNGDGWGGGCDPQDHEIIRMLGYDIGYCSYDNGFGELYPINEISNNQYLIQGSFSKTFTKDEAIEILKSFEILK